MTQPQALYLADVLEDAGKPADIAEAAANELRRLHAENKDLLAALQHALERFEAIPEHRDEIGVYRNAAAIARAAIAKAEGEKT